MILDAHQHFWKYHPAKDVWITDDMSALQRDFLPNELSEIFIRHAITGCVAIQADQSEDETNFLIQQAHEHKFIKGIVGWVDFKASNIEERLAHYAQLKIVKGFRHIAQAEPEDNFLLRPDFCRGISFLSRYNLTYDILIQPKHLPFANQFIQRFPTQKFVIDHIAKPSVQERSIDRWERNIRIMAAHKNVYCKVSGLVTEADWTNWKAEDFTPYLDVVFDAFGTERVMYGSDWPVCLVAASYEKQLAVIKSYLTSFSETAQQNVLGKNAIHFYNL